MKRKSNKARNLIDFSENDQINMWKFILRNVIENKKFQRVDESLWEEYVKTNHLDHSSSDIEHFYNSNMVKSLYKSDLSANEILLLYQHLEIPISKHVEEMLEEDCKVLLRLNAQKILVNYRFINSNRRDSSEIRKTTNSISEPMVKKRRTDDSNEGAVLPDDLFVSDNLEKKMMEFVKKNMHRVNEFLTPNFWKEFSKSEGLEFSSPYLLARVFHTWLPDLFKSKMEIANKLKIMQEFMVLVTPEQKYWLLRHNNVEVFINSNGHVEKWEILNNECEIRNKRVSDVMKSNKKRIHLKKSKSEIASWNQKETVEELESPRNKNTLPQCSTSHSAPNRQRRNLSPDADDSDSENYKPIPREIKCKLKYSEEEDLEIWKFVLEKMLNENMDGPSGEIVKPKGFTLWRTYVKEKKSSRTSETLASHFRKAMIPKLHLANLKAEEIFWLFHLLKIPIENSQKNYLEAKFNAQLEISDKILKKWKIVKKEIVEIGKNNGFLESDKNEEDVTIEEEEEEAVSNENEENVTIEDEEENVTIEDKEENVNVEDAEEAETIEGREDVDAIEQRADAMEEGEKTENTEKGEAENTEKGEAENTEKGEAEADKELEERSEYETIEKTAEAIEEREVAEDNERKTDAIEGGKEAETIEEEEEEEAVTNENEENVTTEDEDKNLNVEDGEENLNVEDGEEAENIKEGAKATEEGHLENKSEVVEGGEAVEQNYDLFAHSMGSEEIKVLKETVLDSNLSMKNEILENILDESKKTNNISDLVDSVKNVVRHENLTALTIEQLKKEMEEILENRLDEMPSIKKEKIEHLIDILVKEFLNKSQNPNVFKIFLENIKERLIECIENI